MVADLRHRRAGGEDVDGAELRRAHRADKVIALGGPSVSAAPEDYAEIDLLHCGEVGDGTLELFRRLDKTSSRPKQKIVYRTIDHLPMTEFPTPAYHLIDIRQYLLGCVQYSSGCPFTCEFCDIPALYGRNPRLKSPQQILGELDELADGGTPSIYFVDDNFIGNPRAALDLLPHLVAWQRRRDYTVRLSCELTLNVAEYPESHQLMLWPRSRATEWRASPWSSVCWIPILRRRRMRAFKSLRMPRSRS